MIDHPLRDIMHALERQTDAVGKARAEYLAKKAEKRNLEARLKKEADGDSQVAKVMNADAHPAWLEFEKALARLEAVYEFQSDKLDLLNKEYQAQYLELKDNAEFLRKRGT